MINNDNNKNKDENISLKDLSKSIKEAQILKLEQKMCLNVNTMMKIIYKSDEIKEFSKEFKVTFESVLFTTVYIETMISKIFECTINNFKELKKIVKDKHKYNSRNGNLKGLPDEKEDKLSLKYIQVAIRKYLLFIL